MAYGRLFVDIPDPSVGIYATTSVREQTEGKGYWAGFWQ